MGSKEKLRQMRMKKETEKRKKGRRIEKKVKSERYKNEGTVKGKGNKNEDDRYSREEELKRWRLK